jgi:hypothetical protein
LEAAEVYYETEQFSLAAKTIASAKELFGDDPRLQKMESRINAALFSEKIKNTINACFVDKVRLSVAKYRCRIRRMITSKSN